VSPGRVLIVVGLALASLGLVLTAFPGLRPGRLPGDIEFGSGNVRVYIPIGTSLVFSVILTLVLWLLNRR
jgi:Protein of unknown function (DUF2905)